MKNICLILGIFFCLNSFSQIPIDSLKEVWENKDLPDSSRLDAVHQIAKKGYLYSHPDSSFYYASLQYAFADSVDMPIQKAEAINTQGISFCYSW